VQFAKVVFAAAGICGIFVTLPLYLLIDFIGREAPPAINHVEFYYGFVGVTLAWQLAFLLIAKDPPRLRLMILPSIFEKASYVLSVLVLFLQHQLSLSQSLLAVVDLIWAVLFTVSFITTDSKPVRSAVA
jgi:hypothetical protein